jgi:DNA-directed RNA polymerase specialized sigma24 family protein
MAKSEKKDTLSKDCRVRIDRLSWQESTAAVEQHLDARPKKFLGIGESAVKTRLHRARLMMREALTPSFAKPKVSVWAPWKGSNPWLAVKR